MSYYQTQRVGVFVDVQNMYYSARALFEKRVNFGNILQDAVKDRELIRAFAYVVRTEAEAAPTGSRQEEQTFFDALAKSGYELRAKDIQVYYGGKKKGDWDVGIAMDTIRLAAKLDVIVLVSGDGDYEPLIEHLQSMGCKVEVMAFGKSASTKLREAADVFTDLSADPERYLMTSARSRAIAQRMRGLRGSRVKDGSPRENEDQLSPVELLGTQREGTVDFGEEDK